MRRLENFLRKISQNYTRRTYVLKCDIKKFFDSIDHDILLGLLNEQIKDEDVIKLLEQIIDSFHKEDGKGLPLGNVTSQVFANVYMNKFDWFMKKELKVKYYIRYCDDFVILSENINYLNELLRYIEKFLIKELKLVLHPNKIEIKKLNQGIDFLGYVVLPHYLVLRTKTKNRVIRKLKILSNNNDVFKYERSKVSYLGVLSHCKSYKVRQKLG